MRVKGSASSPLEAPWVAIAALVFLVGVVGFAGRQEEEPTPQPNAAATPTPMTQAGILVQPGIGSC